MARLWLRGVKYFQVADFKVNLATLPTPREANQVVSENVRQEPSGPVHMRLEYAFLIERRCNLAISKRNGVETDSEFSCTERNQVRVSQVS